MGATIRDAKAWRRAAMAYAVIAALLSSVSLLGGRLVPGEVGARAAQVAGDALPVFAILGTLALLLSPVAWTGAFKVLGEFRRGVGRLPDYGPHPGTGFLIALTGAGALAGSRGGLMGAMGGAAFMFICIGAMFAFGAVDRARGQDRLDRKRRGEEG